jgi:hypothetical protein
MKTIEVTSAEQPMRDFFTLAADEPLVIRLATGKIFVLTAVEDGLEAEDDFADEVARTRHNTALMDLLRARSHEATRVSASEARKRLGLP